MFINKLNDCEKQILMDLLMYVVQSDSKLVAKETGYILLIQQKYGLDMKFSPEFSIEQLCDDVKRDTSKIIVLQELIRAARVDGDYDKKERTIINKVTNYFGVSNEKHVEVDDWVKKGMDWFDRGDDMIAGIRPL